MKLFYFQEMKLNSLKIDFTFPLFWGEGVQKSELRAAGMLGELLITTLHRQSWSNILKLTRPSEKIIVDNHYWEDFAVCSNKTPVL